MSGESTSRAHDRPVPGDAAIVPSPAQSTIVESEDPRVARARSVAKQRLVWGKRSIVLKSAAVGLLASLAVAFLIPRRFDSTARLMPPDQSSSGMGMAMMAAASGTISSQLGPNLGSMAGDLMGLKNSSDLFIGILRSRTVQDDLINKFDLKKIYWDRRMEDAREDLDKHTDFSTDRKSGIISIQVTDRNPQRAAAMAGEYVSELNRVVIELNTSSAHRERVFLEDRLTRVKQDLEAAEKDFSQFASKNTALDVPAQGRAMIEASAELEGQYIAAQTELESLRQIYADGNVRVRAMQARVDELQRQIEKNLGGRPGTLPPTSGEGRTSLYPSIRELPALGVSYADLFRNIKVQEIVFQTLTQQYELAKVEEAKETPSVKVLDPPNVPEKKSFPPRLLIIAAGTILAMVCGVYWVFGKQSWDETDQGDPQKVFALEVIHALQAYSPLATTNGANGNGHNLWGRLRGNREQVDSEK